MWVTESFAVSIRSNDSPSWPNNCRSCVLGGFGASVAGLSTEQCETRMLMLGTIPVFLGFTKVIKVKCSHF